MKLVWFLVVMVIGLVFVFVGYQVLVKLSVDIFFLFFYIWDLDLLFDGKWLVMIWKGLGEDYLFIIWMIDGGVDWLIVLE